MLGAYAGRRVSVPALRRAWAFRTPGTAERLIVSFRMFDSGGLCLLFQYLSNWGIFAMVLCDIVSFLRLVILRLILVLTLGPRRRKRGPPPVAPSCGGISGRGMWRRICHQVTGTRPGFKPYDDDGHPPLACGASGHSMFRRVYLQW